MRLNLASEIKETPAIELTFNHLMQLQGTQLWQREDRITQFISLGNQTCVIKQYHGVGWKEIIKNMFFGRAPIISAKNEWCALNKCMEIGIAVPKPLGFGQRGLNPAQVQSFVLMEALKNAQRLDEFCALWKQNTPNFALKKRLILAIAEIVRTLHNAGINHRDLYACHFLLQDERIYLIDWHRAQIRKSTPVRWRIKDLAALYFSTKEFSITKKDQLRFMQAYHGMSLKIIFQNERLFWNKVREKGDKLYIK